MNEEVLYSFALTKVLPHNRVVQNMLIKELGSAKNVYENRNSIRDVLPDAREVLLQSLANMDRELQNAEQEIAYAEKYGIECLCKGDMRYPQRLSECPDAPILLFYQGTADLNALRIVSIVGMRKCTEYGKSFCRHFLHDLSELCPDVVVVSGLAYGIDVEAHRQSLSNGMQTIAVLAHGMDQMYPILHKNIAMQMVGQGGLLTEYPSHRKIEKVNFVTRNRIVAGVADAVVVVESKEKGGSLITAQIANDYNREVFAVPGRIGDQNSSGCNGLIRDNKAMLLSSAREFAAQMGWSTEENKKKPVQLKMFHTLSIEEQKVVMCIKESDDGKETNQVCVETNIPFTQLSSILFELEMKGVLKSLSGGRYILL